MAFRTFSQTINDSTATQVLIAQGGDLDVQIRTTGATDFYIGGPDVSVGNGLEVEDGKFQTRIRPGDELWALAADGASQLIRVLVRSA